MGLWLGGVAFARAGRSTRGAAGKYKAKMSGDSSDDQMADAAGAAGSGANGAGGPAGRAGSEASVCSGSRHDGSSADNGRDMRGGGLAADDPDKADYQAAELPLVAYLLNIWILGPVAPLTGQYSRGGLN